MKKCVFVILCCLVLITLTGCGKNKGKLACTRVETEEDITTTMEVIFDFDDDDKVKDVTSIFDFGDQETADLFCEAYKQSTDASRITCSGTKITITDSGDTKDEEESNKWKGRTREDVTKTAEDSGFTCQ